MKFEADIETFPIAGEFRISRGAKCEARVVVARVSENGFSGVGECTPYPRYGETPEAVQKAISDLSGRLSRDILQQLLPPEAPVPPHSQNQARHSQPQQHRA